MLRLATPIAIACGLFVDMVAAQTVPVDYPTKAVKIIVNVAPGGGVDTTTRMIAAKLEQRFGHPFVIENRGGAGGNIGAEAVFAAEPDGYTLLASSGSPLAINSWLYKKLSYEPRGFEVAAIMSRIPNVLLVRPNFPAQDIREFLVFAKDHPGTLTYASQGTGTASHLTAEMFMAMTGTKLIHVPYKGTGPALKDILSSHVDLTFIQVSNAYELHRAGKARILAVATDKRMEILPDMPTLAEAGLPNIATDTWNAISAPPKTPPAVTAKLNAAIGDILASPEMAARFREMQMLAGSGGPAEVAKFVADEHQRWGIVIQAAGLKPE
jgi:tripartite-type tricarboxylate transporter receptor subunit TctC